MNDRTKKEITKKQKLLLLGEIQYISKGKFRLDLIQKWRSKNIALCQSIKI